MTIHPATRRLGERIAAIEAEQRNQATSAKLAHSSIEDGSVDVKVAGETKAFWGLQPDGTVATVYTDGPTPGAPAAPHLVAHQLAVVVQWDGEFETGPAPLDLAHVQVHVSEHVDELGKFAPTLDTLTGTLTPGGGALTFAGDNDTHYVCLVAVSTSSMESPPSDFQSVTPLPADVIMGEELIGKVVTGGVVRTAPEGARVELNATVDEQSVRFVGSRGDVATITQLDYTDTSYNLVGSGIAFQSSAGSTTARAAGLRSQSMLLLAPDTVGQAVTDPDSGTTLSEIVAWPDEAEIQAGKYRIAVGTSGIRLYNGDTGYDLRCDAHGTWTMRGDGDVGGPTGGILKLFDPRKDPYGQSYFMELDVNEIQSNPYGETLHLNLDSGSDVTLAGKLRVKGNASGTPVLATYGGGQGDVGTLFSGVDSGRLYVTKWDGSDRRPLSCSSVTQDSDPALKADIAPIDTASALTEVLAAPAYEYTFIGDESFDRQRGLMAPDLDASVATPADDYGQGIKPYAALATLWAAVQSLAEQMESRRD